MPATITYEAGETAQYLDPAVSYYSYDYNVMQNVYEPILWYNSSCATCVIPWLASSYSGNTAGTQYTFTLRSGISFADSEQLNSSVVWFNLNRALILDGSTPVGHGTQSSWLIQQLSNQSLSTFFSGAQTYGTTYVNEWLAQNFVQVTGQYTFNVNVENPNAAFPYLFSNPIVDQLAPGYVEQHDLGLWTAAQRRVHAALHDADRELHAEGDRVLRRHVGDLQLRFDPLGMRRHLPQHLDPGLHGRNRAIHDDERRPFDQHHHAAGQPKLLGRPLPVRWRPEDRRADQDCRLQVRGGPDDP